MCPCGEPLDFWNSMATYAASHRPNMPPMHVALLPCLSWQGWLPQLQKGHCKQTFMPKRCFMTNSIVARKPCTVAKGSRAKMRRLSSHVAPRFSKISIGHCKLKSLSSCGQRLSPASALTCCAGRRIGSLRRCLDIRTYRREWASSGMTVTKIGVP